MIKSLLKKIIVLIITLEAFLVLLKYKPKIIAITGSVGKTGTKNAITTLLSKRFFVWSSPKTYNSEIGVPLTILGKENGWYSVRAWLLIFLEGLALIFLKNHYPKILIVEVGTGVPGDIRSLTRWFKPEIVVVTRFSEVPPHVEFFKSREALIEEKTHLIKTLKKGGALVLNADDKEVLALKNKVQESISTVTFGFSDQADMRASSVQIIYNKKGIPEGISFKVHYEETLFPLKIFRTIGVQYVSVALAALAVGTLFKINIVEMLQILSDFEIPKGRFRFLSGVRNSLIIDDSYNSSPVALAVALDSLEKIDLSGIKKRNLSARKIVVLGDMLELGKYSAEEHKRAGKKVAKIADIFVAVGLRAQGMWEGALLAGMKIENARHFNHANEAAFFLKDIPQEGDIVLVKGSQSMRMEKIVEKLMDEPEKKSDVLVRQEKEWGNK